MKTSLASFLILVGCSSLVLAASLEKRRTWPTTVPLINSELTTQYEYDPEAGGVSAQVISIDTQTVAAGNSSGIKINFKNGVPLSWHTYGGSSGQAAPSIKTLPAYHGFGALYSSQYATTTAINFTSKGRWPAGEFKLLTTAQPDYKTLLSCTLKGSNPAKTQFPNLPGQLFHYYCLSSVGGGTSASGKLGIKISYSDYLDMGVTNTVDLQSSIDTSGFLNSSNSLTIEFTTQKVCSNALLRATHVRSIGHSSD